MWITKYSDYKRFLRDLIETYPKKGRGQSRRLAEHLNVEPVVVSQIMARDRHFTLEQALKVTEFFGLNDKDREYFILLVSSARADSPDLRTFYQKKLDQLRSEIENVKNLVPKAEVISEKDRGIFYSNWYYSGVRILTSMEKYQSVDAIAEYLRLPRSKVGEIVSFLIETGLCIQDAKGRIIRGPKQTILDKSSPFANSHRRNWRQKAQEKFTAPDETDLFITSPVALSQQDAERLKKEILKLFKEFSDKVVNSPEETTMCLNIDWFRF